MARRAAKLSRFTPLLESGSGLRSRSVGGRPVFQRVTIIKAGLGNHRDRNFYPAATLETAVKNGQFDGLRAYADHPDSVSEEIQPERTIRDMVGIYKSPRFVREGQDGGRVVADLHLFRRAKWLGDVVDDLRELGQADKIGISINGRGKTVEKSMTFEESADPVAVNFVEEFMTLRSADVVTEAGAGGGFQQLLESAKGTAHTKENGMNRPNAKQKKAIEAAQKRGDWNAMAKILKECGCDGTTAKETDDTAVKKGAKGAKGAKGQADVEETKKARRAAAAAEETDETDDAVEDDDVEDPLDAVHEEIVAEADELSDDEDGDEDGDALDEADEDNDAVDDVDDSDEEDDAEDLDEADEEADEEPVARRTAHGDGRHPLAGAAAKIRQSAQRQQGQTREASRQPLVKGGAGVVTRGRRGKGGKAKGPGNGQTAFIGVKGLRGKQGGGQKGRRFGESHLDDSPTLARLVREVEKLRETNARLSTQLRVRTTADRARNLLRESSIPEKLQPEILRRMVGKSEDEMQQVVQYHERLVESVVGSVINGTGRVEGAGETRFRESAHGGAVGGDDLSSVLEEAGIPLADE